MIPDFLFRLPLDKIKKYSDRHKIDWAVLACIVDQESAGRYDVTRHEPRWRYGLFHAHAFAMTLGISQITEENLQKTSYGYCQLMGVVMREMGYKGNLIHAIDPDINLEFGARKIKELMLRYEGETRVISAYNAGSPRMINGMFTNQKNYVDPVYARLGEIRKLI